MSDLQTIHDESIARGHEVSTINVRQVVIALLGLLGLIGFTFVVTFEFVKLISVETRGNGKTTTTSFNESLPKGVPPLQVDQAAELLQLVASQRAFLNSFGTDDEKQQVLRIPIDDAISILAKEGEKALSKSSSGEEADK